LSNQAPKATLRVAGLFAGIGGIERGLHKAGHECVFLCESDPAARVVLRRRFPEVRIRPDVRKLSSLPHVDVLAAGFPCQDLSQAGRASGIHGGKSGVVSKLFSLLEELSPRWRPNWLLVENVPFMLHLDGGRAIKYLTDNLTSLGYSWAYRVLDTRAFGLPQRRRRVFLLASREGDPREVLLADDVSEPAHATRTRQACGFYWTEGNRGLGWAVDAIPPLKGSSGLGIPSPPGVWMPNGAIAVPTIEDAERLQGFPKFWTKPVTDAGMREGARWRLVGNAVSVPVAEWIGGRLARPGKWEPWVEEVLVDGQRWPDAAWGKDAKAYRVERSPWPVSRMSTPLHEFLKGPRPLSWRAAAGFLARVRASSLRVDERFMRDLSAHVAALRGLSMNGQAPRARR
jgi:DNA (cytosine-5)-methyltransferase 1